MNEWKTGSECSRIGGVNSKMIMFEKAKRIRRSGLSGKGVVTRIGQTSWTDQIEAKLTKSQERVWRMECQVFGVTGGERRSRDARRDGLDKDLRRRDNEWDGEKRKHVLLACPPTQLLRDTVTHKGETRARQHTSDRRTFDNGKSCGARAREIALIGKLRRMRLYEWRRKTERSGQVNSCVVVTKDAIYDLRRDAKTVWNGEFKSPRSTVDCGRMSSSIRSERECRDMVQFRT
jgi:hypothetical protein